jgi:CRP/FNR family transcriptional regulator, cyclic AMP receptor protein
MSARSILEQVPLFAKLSEDQLNVLAGHLRFRRYRKGATIFHQGDPGTALYLIEKGEVKLTILSLTGKEVVLGLLGPGAFFGELALLDGETRSSNAIVRTTCELQALEREHLFSFLESHPQAGGSMFAALGHRLRRTTEQLHDVVFLDGPGRLAKALLQFTQTRSGPGPDGILRPPRLTQDDLGEIVGGTRESINRWLRAFARQGLIRCRRGSVTVLRPAELEKILY